MGARVIKNLFLSEIGLGKHWKPKEKLEIISDKKVGLDNYLSKPMPTIWQKVFDKNILYLSFIDALWVLRAGRELRWCLGCLEW